MHYDTRDSHRDDAKAARFIDTLVDRLRPERDATILDLACGTGRHARRLASRGYRVLGIDLSTESIREAKKSEGSTLWFHRHDMRLPFGTGVFDYVFNLFSSFGYLTDLAEHLTVVHNVSQSLKPGGRFVLDYLNVARAERDLVSEETTRRNGMTYRINRWADPGYLFKRIVVHDSGGRAAEYLECVAKLAPEEFRFMFELCDMKVEQVYGDYRLRSFEVHASPRLIMVARKSDGCGRYVRRNSTYRSSAEALSDDS